MRDFWKGVDLSTLPSVEADGGCFYLDGKQMNIWDILVAKGVNAVRLRIWNNPYDGDGNGYGAGNCDLANLLALAKETKRRKLDFFLCIHYSDFWADPSRQSMPKAWTGLTLEKLAEQVNLFTKELLQTLIDAGCAPDLVQVGNEITNGMLWPVGKLGGNDGCKTNYASLAVLLNAGISAVRCCLPNSKVVIHLENSCNNVLYRDWLDNILSQGVDFDILGVSYYPNWHGTISALAANLKDVALRYGKRVMIAETAYAFTTEKHLYSADCEPVIINEKLLAEKKDLFPFAITKQGQKQFLEALFELCEQLDLAGIFYWEAAWLPTQHSTWATLAGRKHINEEHKKGGNEWCNQCLFDYEGNALPALNVYSRTFIRR